MLTLHTAWGFASSRTGWPIRGGGCLLCSSPVQARRFEADHGRQVPHRCLERLVGPRNRTTTKAPAPFASAPLRNLPLSPETLECLPKLSLAHVVPRRACRVLAVLKTMTGDNAAGDTEAQEFDAMFTARAVAFLEAAFIPQAIPNRATVSDILPAARVVRLLRRGKGGMF